MLWSQGSPGSAGIVMFGWGEKGDLLDEMGGGEDGREEKKRKWYETVGGKGGHRAMSGSVMSYEGRCVF